MSPTRRSLVKAALAAPALALLPTFTPARAKADFPLQSVVIIPYNNDRTNRVGANAILGNCHLTVSGPEPCQPFVMYGGVTAEISYDEYGAILDLAHELMTRLKAAVGG